MFAIEETTKNNVLGTINVFEALKYSNKIGAYITLGNDWENPYTISKTCSARFAFMFNREFQTRISVIRGLNVYGTKQKLFPVIKAIPTFKERCWFISPKLFTELDSKFCPNISPA